MLRIRCPWCGERDEIEFRYRGDASRPRPAADAGLAAFCDYVYQRDNPQGWHLEWWLHVGGCRTLLKIERHTLSHEIRWIGAAADQPPRPMEPGR
ncbi:MAG TPA: sarcosine oxidase subunit delta [Steroidobacteraceae bacterium]|jgi:heterotetrameric sarcosine oxidase delta subunit